MSMMNSTSMAERNFSNSEVVIDYKTLYEKTYLSQTEDYVVGIVFMFMGLLGVIFNPLTIYIIAQGQHISKKIKIQLINLAVADLLNSIIRSTVNTLAIVHFSFPQILNLCRVTSLIGTIVSLAPLLCNATICLERFALVYFPIKTKSSYKKIHKCLVVAAIWLCASVLGSIVAFDSKVADIKLKVVCMPNDKGILSLEGRRLLYGLAFAVPTIIIVVFYILVFIKLYLNSKEKETGLRRHFSSQRKKKQDGVSMIYILRYTQLKLSTL